MNPNDPKLPPAEEFRDPNEVEGMNVAKVHGSILREREDPQDGYEPIPLWLVTFIMIVVFWGGMYLAYNSGGFQSNVFDPSRTAWAGGGAAQEKAAPDPIALGRRVFTQNCVVCHQATGLGVAGQFPPLAGSEWVLSEGWHGDNHLVKILAHGLQGVVQVKGETYNNAMPAQKLTDAQIANVLTYIRSEWGNNAPPISEAFVAEVRAQSADRTEPWTQAELQAIERVLDTASGTPPAPPAADATATDSQTPPAPADSNAQPAAP